MWNRRKINIRDIKVKDNNNVEIIRNDPYLLISSYIKNILKKLNLYFHPLINFQFPDEKISLFIVALKDLCNTLSTDKNEFVEYVWCEWFIKLPTTYIKKTIEDLVSIFSKLQEESKVISIVGKGNYELKYKNHYKGYSYYTKDENIDEHYWIEVIAWTSSLWLYRDTYNIMSKMNKHLLQDTSVILDEFGSCKASKEDILCMIKNIKKTIWEIQYDSEDMIVAWVMIGYDSRYIITRLKRLLSILQYSQEGNREISFWWD